MNPRSVDILGVGDLDRDIFIRVPHLPAHDEKVTGQLLGEMTGGMVANFCVSAARLGATVELVSQVGDDERGAAAIRDLVAEGVGTEGVAVRPGGTTYFCLVQVDDTGEKALTVVPTDCMFPDPAAIEAIEFERCRLVHMAVPDVELAIDLSQRAQRAGTLVSLDMEPALAAGDPDGSRRLLANVDILIANQAGARALTGQADPNPRSLLRFGPDVAVITRGANGAVAATTDDVAQCGGPRVEVRDTTGAGDCFGAAFCFGCLQDWPLDDALWFATAAAAESVQHVGGHTGSPRRQQVERALASIAE